MIKPEQVQDGGVEVVHVYLVTGHSVGGEATLAIGKATFHSAAVAAQFLYQVFALNKIPGREKR